MVVDREAQQAFVRALDEPLSQSARTQADLGRVLGDVLHAGQHAWPGVTLLPHDFLAYVAERLTGDDLTSALAEVRVTDLFVCCACARGDAIALRLFESTFFDELHRAVRRFDAVHLEGDLLQQVRERLFVSPPEGAPKIASYDGRGDLRVWLRVTGVRMLINLVTRGPKERAVSDDQLLDLAGGTGDVELDYLKNRYSAEIKTAFSAALASLAVRDRNLLRQSLLDKLGIDALGALYGVHRATAARWIEAARDRLTTAVRLQLRTQLGVEEQELDSILRMVDSKLEVSFGALRTGAS